MRVLLLTQVVPFPPDSGPKIKTWNLLKCLADRHEITLAAFARGETAAELAALRARCRAVHSVPLARGALRDAWHLAASLCAGRPFMMQRDARAAMHALVARLTRDTRFDLVHVDQLNMAQYAPRLSGAATVLDAHNALWLVYRRLADTTPQRPLHWLWSREARRLRDYEGACGRAADAVLAVSEADRDALAEVIGGPERIVVAPIGIDPDEVPPLARRPEADRIVHIGTMHWPPNVDGVRWFVEAVLPRIRRARPTAALDVIGARPPRAVRRLASGDGAVTVAGYVADPTPHLERAAVLVVPLRAAGGMRVKILTALAQGVPVVSTTVGCEGLAVEAGRHLLVADTPEAFAAAVLRLLADRGLGATLARNGRALVERRYEYRTACRPVLDLYDRLAGPTQGSQRPAGAA